MNRPKSGRFWKRPCHVVRQQGLQLHRTPNLDFSTYPGIDADARFARKVTEIQDKPANTASVMRGLKIPGKRVIIIGDSGGDGPHFEWGASVGGSLVGSMTKPSLEAYCGQKGINIHHRLGTSYSPGMNREADQEPQVDFKELSDIIESFLAGSAADASR